MSADAIKLNLALKRGAFDLKVDLQIPDQGITAIFGRSGSSKTSLLRCIAGLEPNCQGKVHVRDQVWQDARRFVPTHKRPLGYVIQTPNLFPHLSVQGNLDFARRRASGDALGFDQVVTMLALESLLDRDPAYLSGGEVLHIHHKVYLPTYTMFDESRYFAYGETAFISDSVQTLNAFITIAADGRVTDANAADIAAICLAVDGLPLAIELAAARADVLTPQAIRARLMNRFELLVDGKAYVQAGGGIVADSVPEQEYRETLDKARGIIDVLGLPA